MSAPFTVDLAAQIAQTGTFQGLVEQGMANNNQLKAIADAAQVGNQGKMNAAFQVWLSEVSTTAMNSNIKFQAISDALGFGIKSTGSTDEAGAAGFQFK